MITAFRDHTDPLNTFRTPVIQVASNSPYTYYARWGDYSQVNPDPAAPYVFWAHHEYCISGSWRTWVAKMVMPFRLGDMNCDGAVNFADIDPFVLALSSPNAYHAAFPNCNILNADCNGDGVVNFADIDPFVALLGH